VCSRPIYSRRLRPARAEAIEHAVLGAARAVFCSATQAAAAITLFKMRRLHSVAVREAIGQLDVAAPPRRTAFGAGSLSPDLWVSGDPLDEAQGAVETR
jgi:hypothetical protein